MENKNFWVIMASNLLSVILIGCGIFLAIKGIKGWGWLIFAALWIYSSPFKLIKKLNKDNGESETEN